MKKLALLFVFGLFATVSTFAQVTPKKEFTVTMSDKNISLAPGESKSVDVTLNRSKAYRKTNIDLLVDSTLPEGITISFEGGADPMIFQTMTITAANDAAPFSKSLILKGKTNRGSKGIMFKLGVNDAVLSANK